MFKTAHKYVRDKVVMTGHYEWLHLYYILSVIRQVLVGDIYNDKHLKYPDMFLKVHYNLYIFIQLMKQGFHDIVCHISQNILF